MWLDPPPLGLSEAERRVLEAFFVGQEAKRAAELLSLATKTVNNELLSARQTMGEPKSWVAAVRYVFYVKRAGLSFTEQSLFKKIDKQIRRLLDDYLDTYQTANSEESEQPLTGSDHPPLENSGIDSGVEVPTLGMAVFDSGRELSGEEFERELQKLTESASLIYEAPNQQHRRRAFPLVVGLIATIAVVLALALILRGLSPPTRENYAGIGEKLGALRGHHPRTIQERKRLVILLSEEFHRELWGPNEESVRAVIDSHAEDIRSVIKSDPKAALQILGNAHRALARDGSPLRTEWFDLLEAAVKANKGTRDIYMVRSLCGYAYGLFNQGRRAGKQPSSEEVEAILRKQAEAAQLAVDLVDKSKVADYAEAIRHLAMTSPTPKRLDLCQQAYKLYLSVDDPWGKRGRAQCFLTIAQTGALEPGGQALVLKRSVKAFDAILPLGNASVTEECVREMKTSLGHIQLGEGNANTVLEVRERLWIWADRVSDVEKFDVISWCLAIDAKLNPAQVGEDLERLISFDSRQFSRSVASKLAGFVFAEARRNRRQEANSIVALAKDPTRASAFAEGQKLSISDAVSLAKTPQLGGRAVASE